jgi:8-oxo-dGTP diphosphatase
VIRVAAGILVREGRVLICRRRRDDAFALRWEFPGGKIRGGESPAAALARELEEELGIRIPPLLLVPVESLRHRYPEGLEVELHFYRADSFEGEETNLAFEEIAWVRPAELPRYDFLEADRPLVARLAAEGALFAS